ncbi:MAG: hypothetical protein MUF06_13710, partial [Pirellulaceae bacterium]|nr:hypothetical protein [Pirellulaceae bacterium]
MSTRELAELACRIIAVALLAFTLLEIAMGLASLLIPIGYAWRSSREMEPVEVLFGTVIVGIPLALRLVPVWFLWTRAEWISRQMVPYAENRSRWPRLRATN